MLSEPGIEYTNEIIFHEIEHDEPDEPTVPAEISLEARISFADSPTDHSQWKHVQLIAVQLGTSDRQVERIIKTLGIEGDKTLIDSDVEVTVYPPFTAGVVGDELAWRAAFRSLPTYIRKSTLIEHTGRSKGWTDKHLEELQIKPIRRKQDNGKVINLYRKTILKTLRKINMAVPLDEGWYNLGQLSSYIGADRSWIEKQLAGNGFEPQQRRSTLTGRVTSHYPPDSIHEIMKLAERRAEPGGEWLTAHAISELIGRSYSWVSKRLEEHKALSVLKLDDYMNSRKHYAPNIVDLLRSESERLHALPEHSDYLNIHVLARRMGRATLWAELALDTLAIEPTEVKDRLGRPRQAYPPSVLAVLEEYERNLPKNGVTDQNLLDSLFAVSSIRSQKLLQRKLIDTYKTYSAINTLEEIERIKNYISQLDTDLSRALNRHYRLMAKATSLPGFITGLKKQNQEVDSP